MIRTPTRYLGDNWTAEKFSVVSGSIATVFEKGLQEQMPVVRLMYSQSKVNQAPGNGGAHKKGKAS